MKKYIALIALVIGWAVPAMAQDVGKLVPGGGFLANYNTAASITIPAASKGVIFVDAGVVKVKLPDGSSTALLFAGQQVVTFNSRSGAVVPATDDYTWAQINKATSSIGDITTRSHTLLTDIGTNSHSQLDTAATNSAAHIANTSNPHGVTKSQVGLASVTDAAQFAIANNLSEGNAATLRTNLALVPGIDVQAFDADLSSIAAIIGTGFATRTAANTWVTRAMTAGSTKLSISNGDGVAGPPTFDIVEANLALSSIGGAVTDAQVPDTITLTNITQVTTRSHASLTDIGTNSHATIDTHIAATAAHGATGAVVGTTNTQTLSGKTLSAPIISTISNTGTLTLPTSTDTLVGKATTDILTGKMIDAEAAGNVITLPVEWNFSTAINLATVASSLFDTPATNAPAAVAETGTNVITATLDFDAATAESAQVSNRLPTGWTGAMDGDVVWYAAAITGAVKWNIQCICGTAKDAAFNTASTVTTTVSGTTNTDNVSSVTSITTTGCAAGESIYFKLVRDAADAGDTMAGDAKVRTLTIRIRKAM